MAEYPDFRPTTPAVQPGAFAEVIQRRQQIEMAQQQQEAERRSAITKQFLDAVVTGQQIASNMMSLSERRSEQKRKETQVEGQQELLQLFGEPATLPPSQNPTPEMEVMYQADREKRFMQAITKADLDKTTEALLERHMPRSTSAAGDTEIRTLLDPVTKQPKDYIINKRQNTVTDLGGNPVPSEIASKLLRGYAPKTIEDPFGLPHIVPNLPGAEPSSASKGTMEEGGIPALQATSPVLAERFVAARDKAFPASNQQLKEATDSAASAGIVTKILTQKKLNEVGLKSLGFHLARMSGSNSQLSDQERQTFEQPLAILERAKNFGYKNIAGDLSPKMKEDLTQLSKLIAKKEKIRGHRAILAAKQNARGQVGESRFKKFQLEKEFPTIDDLIVNTTDFDKESDAADSEVDQFFNSLLGK